MKTTKTHTTLVNSALSSWRRVRSSAELQSLIARRELALARVELSSDDDF